MVKYKIYVDAAADIPKEEQERYRIGVLPIPVAMGERRIRAEQSFPMKNFTS